MGVLLPNETFREGVVEVFVGISSFKKIQRIYSKEYIWVE